MTRRKPGGLSWESWVERQIREARERGELDDLPGAGKPIPGLEKPYDPLWWAKQLVHREGLSLLPETLALRLQVERTLERVWKQRSAEGVRRLVRGLNARILQANRQGAGSPPLGLSIFDEGAVLSRWRERRRDGGPD
ncbi:MAG: DUF1992 domain-containing protein [Planctomycetota bacterium]